MEKVSLSIHVAKLDLEEAIASRPFTEPSRFIPKFTTFSNTKFVGMDLGDPQKLPTLYFSENGALQSRQSDTKEAASSVHLCLLPQGVRNHLVSGDSVKCADGYAWYYPKLHDALMELLMETKVRGNSLLKLFRQLYDRDGVAYPIAVTGGCVRDLIKKVLFEEQVDVNDVDIVIGGYYHDAATRLRDTFGLQGQSLTDSIFRTTGRSKQFGQFKIINQRQEKEPLDIALFKSLKKCTNEESDTKYHFGWSYYEDAQQRDYTFNALYLEIFSPIPFLIDPTGNGLQDLKNRNLRAVDKLLFAKDLGALFRYWKEVKNLNPSVCDPDGEYVSEHLIGWLKSDPAAFFAKMQSKLFKHVCQLRTSLINFDNFLISRPKWWTNVLDFVWQWDKNITPLLDKFKSSATLRTLQMLHHLIGNDSIQRTKQS